MIIFHSDLDNTLIYSYKHEIGSEKRCVELYRGRELSYMTEKSLELLERIRERVLFVPTTTRTVEQYDRIRLGTTRAAYALVCNAEQFVTRAKTLGLTVGQTPRLGAIAVWQAGATLQGSDGAGHVAVVERMVIATEIITSESGWNASKPFWTQTRKKGSGNWGQGSSYKFLGFIYNPAPCCQGTPTVTEPTAPVTKPTATTEKKAKDAARSFDKKLAGTYAVTAEKGLHIRSGAGSGKDSLTVLPFGTKVRNYGYYTPAGGVKWLYIQVTMSGTTYTGFCSARKRSAYRMYSRLKRKSSHQFMEASQKSPCCLTISRRYSLFQSTP